MPFCIVHATAIDEIQDSEDTLGTKNIKKQGHGSQRRTGLDNNGHPESTKNEIRTVCRRNIALLKWDVSSAKRVRRINIAPDWYDGAWKADGDCEIRGNLFVNTKQEMRSNRSADFE
ncbi:hypothetical protein B0H13DRAFT_1877270 [Mycena leptocephala]|nr:hypothetical protein B0H13DRAFT_1877270 [Mycena leptocephala]